MQRELDHMSDLAARQEQQLKWVAGVLHACRWPWRGPAHAAGCQWQLWGPFASLPCKFPSTHQPFA